MTLRSCAICWSSVPMPSNSQASSASCSSSQRSTAALNSVSSTVRRFVGGLVRGRGASGIVWLARVAGAAAPQEGHGPGLKAPPLLRLAIGVGVPADAHVVGGLLHEAECLGAGARPGLVIEVQDRGPGQEQPL